ncbi:MAG: HD domain-containing protein [Planctomycetes bacterium]|nr:HD domain-containing protein [Planctomycetota bacterium]
MRYIAVKNVVPGMIAAKDVYSNNGKLLVRQSETFSITLARNILDSGVSSILIEDRRVNDVRIEELIEPTLKFELYGILKSIYENLGVVQKLWKDVNRQEQLAGFKEIVDAKAATDVMGRIINEIDVISDMKNVNFDKEIILVESNDLNEYLYLHVLNVTILSIAMGKIMKFPKTILMLVAQAAAFHDLGIVYVPKEILMKNGRLTAEEYGHVKTHVEMTAKILQAAKGAVHSHVMTTINQHHENVGGTGYPAGLKDNQIHAFAKIISICNVYEALTAKRPWREAFMPHSAIEYVLAGAGDLFDYNFVKSFTHLIPAYPKGIMVEINTGEKGCVINPNKGVVARPVVRMFYGKDGRELPDLPEYDLSKPEHQTKMITKILND